MQAAPLLRQRWVRVGLYLAFWTSIGLCNVVQGSINHYIEQEPIVWRARLIQGLADWYVWAALTPFILYLARTFPFEQRTWRRSLAVHIPASLLAALVVAICLTLAMAWAGCKASLSENFRAIVFGPFLVFYLWIYWAIVGIRHAWAYYTRTRERELQASRLEAQLAQAQLQVLQMQLQPHFLFNTLHAISALMHQDVELADRMIARLAELLRGTLENAGVQEAPLHRELDFLRPYLEIQKARFGERLRLRLEAGPETLDALVPSLILQPLAENAIRHGIASRPEGGRVEVRARRQGDQLLLQVEDDGPGLPEEEGVSWKEGVGLGNTRARLQQLYGAGHRFDMRNGPGKGLVVTLAIPFRDSTAAAAFGARDGNGTDMHAHRG